MMERLGFPVRSCGRVVSRTVLGFLLLATPASGQVQHVYFPLITGGGGSVQSVGVDGTGYAILECATPANARGIDVDDVAGKMYWSSASIINRADLDGTNKEVLITGVGTVYTGVALDVAAGKLYWLDAGTVDTLNRANLDGTGAEVLALAGLNPNGLALDTVNGRVYWTSKQSQVCSVEMSDGSDLQCFGINSPSGGVTSARDIAVDTVNAKLYWTSPYIDVLMRSNLDGSNQEDVISGGPHYHGVDVDPAAGKVYWTDRNIGTVERANLDGTGQEILVSGLPTVGVAQWGPQYCALGPAPGPVLPTFDPPTPCDQFLTVLEGVPLSFDVATSDPAPGGLVTLSVSGLPVGATMTPPLPDQGNPTSSTFQWTPAPGTEGTYVVTYTTTDGCNALSCTVTIDVVGDCAPGPGAWTDEGFALAGVFGDPLLVGCGLLADGSSNAIDLTNAAPSTLAGLLISLSSTPMPFKGGTLKPLPFLALVILVTDGTGAISLPFLMPPGFPLGTELWAQWVIVDGSATWGFALSNAIKGLTP